MTVAYKLTRHSRLDAIFAVGRSGPVTVGDFLRDVAALSEQLLPRRHVINLCADRYHFTVALAAALMREQISILPPSDKAAVLGGVAAQFEGVYAIHDGAIPSLELPAIAYPDSAAAAPGPSAIPSIPSERKAVVLFTSGSTGQPTPHVKTWGSLVRGAMAAGAALGVA